MILSYVTITESARSPALLDIFALYYWSTSAGIKVSTTFSVANRSGLITAFLISDKAGMNFLNDP